MCFGIIMPPLLLHPCLKHWPPRWQSVSHWHNGLRECLDTCNNTAGRTRPQSLCHLPWHFITCWWLLLSPLLSPLYFSLLCRDFFSPLNEPTWQRAVRRCPFWIKAARQPPSHLQPDIVNARPISMLMHKYAKRSVANWKIHAPYIQGCKARRWWSGRGERKRWPWIHFTVPTHFCAAGLKNQISQTNQAYDVQPCWLLLFSTLRFIGIFSPSPPQLPASLPPSLSLSLPPEVAAFSPQGSPRTGPDVPGSTLPHSLPHGIFMGNQAPQHGTAPRRTDQRPLIY